MNAVVYQGPADIRLENVPDPTIVEPTDAVVRLTTSAICGTDLHMVRDSFPGMRRGTILGHEGVGVVEEVGAAVRNFQAGDRVVIPSTIGCGTCSYCRAGYYSQCDVANPSGGTAFYGGPESTGPFDGLQAEYARIPYANTGMVPFPDTMSDEQAILISDIFPTGWFGAKLAEVRPGDTVAVFGCGPVGLFTIVSAFKQGAGRVIAVDGVPSRLEHARRLHAEPVDFNDEDVPGVLSELTGGIGPDRVVDAVGIDAQRPKRDAKRLADSDKGDTWVPGDSPAQAVDWAVQAVAKAGTLGVIGVYPPSMQEFPLGIAMNKNLAVNMGNCNHRKYIPSLIDMVASGVVDPVHVITQVEPMNDVIAAYEAFDRREPGWTKVVLDAAV